MIENITIIGAGNGGKAAAADLTLQGKYVRLFEFPEYRGNVEEIMKTRGLKATGAVDGQATLELVTCNLAEALEGADTVMVCTQALAHNRVAHELTPLIRPEHLVILNPGSTGGSLHFAHVFREFGLKKLPTFVETSTLTYGCRAKKAIVDVSVKVKRVLYGTLPAPDIDIIGPELEALYPGLCRGASVLEAGLNNANPVIHPPITILNAARIEIEGENMFFYRDGVSPSVANLIRKLDEERMALLRSLGYPAQPDPVTCVEQGYAASTDYYECYRHGPGFQDFRFPNTLDNRYFHEDIGMGLVMLCSLGKMLDVPTPTCRGVVYMGEILSSVDYFGLARRTLETLGLGDLSVDELKSFLETGETRRG
ncbi:MAG: NAD/NADP octopine/nopaline dehydrogenase family protein [Thermodesulfobacteriota bacterium]|nr:NAD/NADP octopine/nopaline dehydrogenase family protein [Thermodesulfobacteriota bacterium]